MAFRAAVKARRASEVFLAFLAGASGFDAAAKQGSRWRARRYNTRNRRGTPAAGRGTAEREIMSKLSSLMCGLVLASAAGAAEPVPWLHDLAEARAAARASGKPIFVVFRCEH
jgi:hypothetical protein